MRLRFGAGWPAREALILALAASALAGAAGILYLVVLPSDVEDRVFGAFSARRLVLIFGLILWTATTAGLAALAALDRRRGDRLGEAILVRPSSRGVLATLAVLVVASITALSVYQPTILHGMNKYHVARLFPYGVCALVAVGSWLFGKRLTGRSITIELPAYLPDAALSVFLFLAAFGVRYPMTAYGLPYAAIWDEVVTYPRALANLAPVGLKPPPTVPGYAGGGWAGYGYLLEDVTTIGQVAGFLDGLRTGRIWTLEEYVRPPDGIASVLQAVHPSGIPLRYPRILISLITSASGVLIYLILRRDLEVSWAGALVGGLSYSVLSGQATYMSSYIVPDGLAVTLVLGAILAAMHVVQGAEKPWLSLWACGLLCGAAVSVVLRYLTAWLLPGLAVLLGRDRTQFGRKMAVAITTPILGFLVTSPEVLSNLPTFLRRTSGLPLSQTPTVGVRLQALTFYVGEIVRDLGWVVVVLALIGLWWAARNHSRQAALLAIFSFAFLWTVTPSGWIFPRYALVLYAITCILAGAGAEFGVRLIASAVRSRKGAATDLRAGGALSFGDPGFVANVVLLAAFLALTAPGFITRFSASRGAAAFQPSQIQAVDYLQGLVRPGDVVGVLDLVPLAYVHLSQRDIPFERLTVNSSLADLRQLGVTYLLGTDMVGGDYPPTDGTIWDTSLWPEGVRMAEFGKDSLLYAGWPVGTLYLYVGRVEAPAAGSTN